MRLNKHELESRPLGRQGVSASPKAVWIPAFAGMTRWKIVCSRPIHEEQHTLIFVPWQPLFSCIFTLHPRHLLQ